MAVAKTSPKTAVATKTAASKAKADREPTSGSSRRSGRRSCSST